jgi:uncharacterized Tic20 family protein
MPLSEDSQDNAPAGQSVAILAEALYLANLLLLPGIAFIALLWLYLKRTANMPPLALCHLRQTLSGSIWAGILLVIANAAIILLGGYGAATTWMIVILYFTTCHSTLVLLGMVGLAKAMAGKPYVYPLVGRAC